VARRVAEARATIPDLEFRCEVDVGRTMAVIEELSRKDSSAPAVNDFIVKAAALALREFPRVNGAYRDGAIETYARVNIGITVAVDDSFLIPTIFDADRKSVAEIGITVRTLGARVRDGTITPAELAGGTFTIASLETHGVDSYSAVINQPQAAIVAVGALKRRPVVDASGDVIARPTLVLTLACDQRILQGAEGARFLSRVRERLEMPDALVRR
jgi:pyruvate dehydrogenase E2 component (dihydrolipoyllysine-residue acetyltransferase)